MSGALNDDPGDPDNTMRYATATWTTRLLIRLDVAVQRRSPLVSMTACVVYLAAVLLVVVAKLMLAGESLQVVYAAMMLFIAVVWWMTGWIGDRLIHRRHRRPARADEIATLRNHARAGTWSCIQDAAADWRHHRPRDPITIAMILDWEADAARKVRAAKPPTIAEQAAARAQALAFN